MIEQFSPIRMLELDIQMHPGQYYVPPEQEAFRILYIGVVSAIVSSEVEPPTDKRLTSS